MIALLTSERLMLAWLLTTTTGITTAIEPVSPMAPKPARAAQTTAVPDTPEIAWPDSVTLASGTVVPCRIVESTPESLVIEYTRRATVRSQTMRRSVAWADLLSADLAMDAEFHHLVAARDPVREFSRVAARWSDLAPMAGRPHHPAGDLALTLARLSLQHPDASTRQRALAACESVVAHDWNSGRRDRARLAQARLLQALGRSEEAGKLARQLTTDPAVAPEAAMPAFLVLATMDFAALRVLESENPRWIDDDLIRPERDALFHRAVEAALKPCLFDGSHEDAASRGLWIAVEVLEFAGQLPPAADAARDLIRLYRNSPAAVTAAAFLHRHRLPLDPSVPTDPPPDAPVHQAEAGKTKASLADPSATSESKVRRRARYAPAPHGPASPPPPSSHPVPAGF